MLQGLLIYNADGTLMHEESLSKDLCYEIIQLAKDCSRLLHPSCRGCLVQLPHQNLLVPRVQQTPSAWAHGLCPSACCFMLGELLFDIAKNRAICLPYTVKQHRCCWQHLSESAAVCACRHHIDSLHI